MFLKKFIKIVKALRVAAVWAFRRRHINMIKDLEVYLKGSCHYFKLHTIKLTLYLLLKLEDLIKVLLNLSKHWGWLQSLGIRNNMYKRFNGVFQRCCRYFKPHIIKLTLYLLLKLENLIKVLLASWVQLELGKFIDQTFQATLLKLTTGKMSRYPFLTTFWSRWRSDLAVLTTQ